MGEGEERKPNPFPALKMKTGVSATKPRAPIKAGASLIKLIWHAIPAASGEKASDEAGQHLAVVEVGQALITLRAAVELQAHSGKGWGLMASWTWGPDDGRMGWGKMRQARKPTPSSSSRGKGQRGSHIPA